MKDFRRRTLLVAATAVLLMATPVLLHAQDPVQSRPPLDEHARMDSLRFDASLVSCRADVANAIFDGDVEFYHDLTGFASGEQVRANTARLAASCPREQGVSRVLVPGSVEVHPLSDYGAIQMGMHRFEERGTPTHTVAKFVHVWRATADGWRLARVLSFDHRSVANE